MNTRRRKWLRKIGAPLAFLGAFLLLTAGSAPAATREVRVLAQAYPGCLCFTHWYFAQDKYLKKFGYKMKFNPGTTIQNPIQILVAGVVDFAEVDPFEIISAISKGVPIVAISTTTAISPVGFHSLAKTGIKKPRDYMGKIVGFFPGGDHEMMFWETMDRAGLSKEEKAKITGKVIGVSIAPLLAGLVQARSYWSPVEFLKILTLRGMKFDTIQASDYGVILPANAIIVRKAMLEKDPKYVEQAMAAFAKGLEGRMRPEMRADAVKAALKRINPKMFKFTPEQIQKGEEMAFDHYIKFMDNGFYKTKGAGWSNLKHWRFAQELMFKNKLLKKKDALKDSEFFTNAILDRIYVNGKNRYFPD
ncbi:MAG: ABC transporter substrate-binding protein [bacterium]